MVKYFMVVFLSWGVGGGGYNFILKKKKNQSESTVPSVIEFLVRNIFTHISNVQPLLIS